MTLKVAVIGGGAAGFFGAIAAAEQGHDVTIFEAGSKVLSKVRISGGGRCNVTHSCFDPKELVKCYPRGGKELRGPLSRFQPADTIEWFADRGVRTKTESDGRMFPTTDDSQTIVDCLIGSAEQQSVNVRTGSKVRAITAAGDKFQIDLGLHQLEFDRVLMASGGTRGGFAIAESLSHKIIPPVPSLFTFNIQDPRISGLPGVAVEHVTCLLVADTVKFQQQGPMLITHWGMSGPAVLKLSAWAARELHTTNYSATLRINWLPSLKTSQVQDQLRQFREENRKRSVESVCPFPLPKRLWKSLVDHAVGEQSVRWAELSKKAQQRLLDELTAGTFKVTGKGEFKEEFVTCGGVALNEIDFRTMQSRICPGLFFAGEILDIDGITGGFNFQNAWTTSWIAGNSM